MPMGKTLVFEDTLAFARSLDERDPLKGLSAHFKMPVQENGAPYLYFCGNSLGVQPKKAAEYLQEELDTWAQVAVEGHFVGKHPWVNYHELLSETLARLVCAKTTEVVAMNSLTVNLHLLMASFYKPTHTRYKILVEADAFPSDLYAVASQAKWHGLDPALAVIKVSARAGEHTLHTEDILEIIEEHGDSIALVMFGGVNYYTGQVLDMKTITHAAKEAGCVVGWDLAHAVGNVPMYLHEWGVDFAAWCCYKYLNGGPGTVSGCFIHEKYVSNPDTFRLAGWWGHNKSTRFEMGPDFDPILTAEGWQLSNQPILALAPLRASLELFDEVGIFSIREKSIQLTGFLRHLLSDMEIEGAFQILTPAETQAQGCQLSLLTRADGKNLFTYLENHGVICDWREPNVIRLAPAPLYNTFEEVWQVAQLLREAWGKIR